MAKIVYECSAHPEKCDEAEFEEHPAQTPRCCGKPMEKTKDACCEPAETSDACC